MSILVLHISTNLFYSHFMIFLQTWIYDKFQQVFLVEREIRISHRIFGFCNFFCTLFVKIYHQ